VPFGSPSEIVAKPFYSNDDHFHLRFAQIGVLWTSIENSRQGRRRGADHADTWKMRKPAAGDAAGSRVDVSNLEFRKCWQKFLRRQIVPGTFVNNTRKSRGFCEKLVGKIVNGAGDKSGSRGIRRFGNFGNRF
jgi:hypothetical protein